MARSGLNYKIFASKRGQSNNKMEMQNPLQSNAYCPLALIEKDYVFH